MIFERPFIHQLTCPIEKCKFGKEKLEYLDHLVSTDGKEARKEHIQTILGFLPPRTKKELQKFLGTYNWLRKYIPDFATLSTSLTNLLAEKKRSNGPKRLSNHSKTSSKEWKNLSIYVGRL